MKKVLIALVLLMQPFLLLAQDDAIKVVKYPEGYTAQLNTVYTKVGDWEGKVDLYLPANTGKPSPVIINIHGGGWNHGVKESQGGFNSFFKMGYAVANMEYRLVGTAPAPAAVEDTRCMLIYLIKNAKELNIDINKIVIMGASAGGHLALMGGLLANNHLFDTNCPGVKNVKVAAIIDKYGPADLTEISKLNNGRNSGVKWMGPHANDPKFIASVSPIFYVDKNSPPTFIVHGTADPLVPYQQSVSLHEKLVAAGVKTQFISVDGGHHGGFPKEKMTEISDAITEFLKSLGL
jgi:acetyl esterase/lipase